MATINLGKVKGEPFRYEDFTQEQLNALKGKDFKYEDFSPEQLEKLKSKIEVGNVTTLDADEQASVTPRVNGNTTTLDFAIPRGNGVNSYSGTREEYEDIADTIKDGSLVNITDENDFDDENLIGQVTMQRLNDIEDNFDNIKPHALTNPTNNLLATVAGTPLDAVQGKVLNDKVTVQEELDNIFHLTVSGSNKNISKILSDAGIDSDLTFQENMGLLKNISANRDLKSISIFTNSNSSAFNTSLPVSNGGILEVHYPKYNRRIFKFYSYKTADVYVNYELDGTYGTWEKLVTETELNKKGTVTNIQLADATPVSVLSNNFSNVTEVPLEKGNYVIVITVTMQKNATGNRGFYFGGNSSPTYATVTVPNSGANNDARIQHTAVLEIGGKTNYYFAPYQNSGQSLNMTYSSIKIVKL